MAEESAPGDISQHGGGETLCSSRCMMLLLCLREHIYVYVASGKKCPRARDRGVNFRLVPKPQTLNPEP